MIIHIVLSKLDASLYFKIYFHLHHNHTSEWGTMWQPNIPMWSYQSQYLNLTSYQHLCVARTSECLSNSLRQCPRVDQCPLQSTLCTVHSSFVIATGGIHFQLSFPTTLILSCDHSSTRKNLLFKLLCMNKKMWYFVVWGSCPAWFLCSHQVP